MLKTFLKASTQINTVGVKRILFNLIASIDFFRLPATVGQMSFFISFFNARFYTYLLRQALCPRLVCTFFPCTESFSTFPGD